MHKREKWSIALLIAVAIFATSIVAFGAVTINIWTVSLKPAFNDYMGQVITSFENSHPDINVNWVDIPYGAMVQKLTAAIAAGQPPDAVNLNTPWIIDFASKGGLAPMEKYFSVVDQYSFWKGVWDANVVNGHSYGVPWYVGSIDVLMYNREIFKAAGLDPNKPPTTWEERTQYAEILKEKTGVYGFCPSISAHREVLLAGVPIVNSDATKAAFDDPAVVKRLEWYEKLYKENLMPHDLGGYMEARQLFGSKQLAMYIAGISQVKHIQINSPDVYAVTDVAPVPAGAGGIYSERGWSWSIPYNAPNPKEGAEFIRQITSPYWQVEFSKYASVIPSTKIGLQTDPWFLERANDPCVKALMISSQELSHSKNLDAVSTTGIPPAKFQPIRRIMNQYWTDAIQGKYTAEQALNLADKAVNEILAGK